MKKKSNRINSCGGDGDVFPRSLRQQRFRCGERKFRVRHFQRVI